MNAAACVCAQVSESGDALRKIKRSPLAETARLACQPPAALSTMTGALFTGIAKDWVADQNSAGR